MVLYCSKGKLSYMIVLITLFVIVIVFIVSITRYKIEKKQNPYTTDYTYFLMTTIIVTCIILLTGTFIVGYIIGI